MAARQATVVVQHAVIDHFANGRADFAAQGRAAQATEDGADHRAGGRSTGTGDQTDAQSDPCTTQGTGDTAGCARETTERTADFSSKVAGLDPLGLALGALEE